MRGVSVVVLLALPCALEAQRCQGTTGFDARRFGFVVSRAATINYNSIGAGLAFGRPSGFWMSLHWSRVDYEAFNFNAQSSRLVSGYTLGGTPAKRIQLCPIVSYASQNGPDYVEVTRPSTITVHEFRYHTIGVGGATSVSATLTSQFDVIPSVGVRYYAQVSQEEVNGQTTSVTEMFGFVSVGAGSFSRTSTHCGPRSASRSGCRAATPSSARSSR